MKETKSKDAKYKEKKRQHLGAKKEGTKMLVYVRDLIRDTDKSPAGDLYNYIFFTKMDIIKLF